MARKSIGRRRLLGGLGVGGLGVGGLGMLGLGDASVGAEGHGDGRPVSQEPGAAPSTVTPSRSAGAELSPSSAEQVTEAIASIDFHPISSSPALSYAYVGSGGFQVTAGDGFFNADLRVPVGSRITGVQVFLNPNGSSRSASVARHRTAAPPDFESVGPPTASTNGSALEAIVIPVDHVVEAGWTYRITDLFMSVSGPILYGAQVTYVPPGLPPQPGPVTGGQFQPFAGANPRVYDSRAGAKLAPGEERVVPLGVSGTAAAAMFNLTATQTEGAGFVSAYRAGIAWPGNSSINWSSSGLDIANMVVSAVDGSGRIVLRGGNAATHVIVDLIGTFE